MIHDLHFAEIYETIKTILDNLDFKQIASETLLNQPATIDDYYKISEYMIEYLLDGKQIGSNIENEILREKTLPRPIWSAARGLDYSEYDMLRISSDKRYDLLKDMLPKIKTVSSRYVEILPNFSHLEAVPFYRKIIHKEFYRLFNEFKKKSLISQGLYQFMLHDNYLSPFSSYPTHSLRFLLFSQPFHRMYDDFYLIHEDDLDRLDLRARAIFDNFSNFLFEFFRYKPPKNMQILEEQTRQLIYQWNIASTNFDSIRLYLESVYGRELGSGMYHIKSNGLQFAIFDLDTNDNLLPFYGEGEYYFESMPIVFKMPWEDCGSYMSNSSEYIKPCNLCASPGSFEDNLIPMDRILSDLISKFSEYGWNYG